MQNSHYKFHYYTHLKSMYLISSNHREEYPESPLLVLIYGFETQKYRYKEPLIIKFRGFIFSNIF